MLRITVLLVLVSLVLVPVAMAIDGCTGNGATCAALCSAPCISTPAVTDQPMLAGTEFPISALFASLRVAPLDVPDAPPKTVLSA